MMQTDTDNTSRRSQSDRREDTQARLIAAATQCFGTQGYLNTHLKDIATACDITVAPIYHYYDSKIGLFQAVTDHLETHIISEIKSSSGTSPEDIWLGFMKRCEDPVFRQIMIIDAPTILDRGRMAEGAINETAKAKMAEILGDAPDSLSIKMLIGALSQAALHITQKGANETDYDMIKRLITFFSNPSKVDEGSEQ